MKLTENQQIRIEELKKEAKKAGRNSAFRVLFLVLVGSLVVNLVNIATVNDFYFVMFMSFVTGILVSRDSQERYKIKMDELDKELKEIVAGNQ